MTWKVYHKAGSVKRKTGRRLADFQPGGTAQQGRFQTSNIFSILILRQGTDSKTQRHDHNG
jgi:hypothetical protein